MPSDGSPGVDDTFQTFTFPVALSKRQMSVKVPPESMPIRNVISKAPVQRLLTPQKQSRRHPSQQGRALAGRLDRDLAFLGSCAADRLQDVQHMESKLPLARCGRPRRIAAAMSATPIAR